MSTLTHRLAGPDQLILVVEAPAEIGHDSADDLVSIFRRHLPNRDDAGAILDLSGVVLISSIGVTAILQIREVCGDRGAEIMLAGVPERQLEFLKMLRLDRKFEIVESVEAGLASFESSSG